MNIKRLTVSIVCAAALSGVAYTTVDVPSVSAHGYYPALRHFQKCGFKTIHNKHITIKMPKYVVASSKENLNYDAITQLLGAYNLKGVHEYKVTGFGQPQIITKHGGTLKINETRHLKKITATVNGKQVAGYVGNLLIKKPSFGHHVLKGTISVNLFIPVKVPATVTFNAGEGAFGTDVKTATIESFKDETLTTDALPTAPTRAGFVFTGWTKATTNAAGNVVYDKLAKTVDLTKEKVTGDTTYFARWGIAQKDGQRVSAIGQQVNFLGQTYFVVKVDETNQRAIILAANPVARQSQNNAMEAIASWYTGVDKSQADLKALALYPEVMPEYSGEATTVSSVETDSYAFLPSTADISVNADGVSGWSSTEQYIPANRSQNGARLRDATLGTEWGDVASFISPIGRIEVGGGNAFSSSQPICPAFWVNY